MKTSAVTAFLMLMAGLIALPILAQYRSDPLTPAVHAGDSFLSDGLLAQVGQVESDIHQAKNHLARAGQSLAMGDPPQLAQATNERADPDQRPRRQHRPVNMATTFDWECPKEFQEHSQHVFTIVTDAKFIDPIVEDGFDEISLHGPVITESDPESGLRELSYSWTAPPNDTGYSTR